MRHALIYGAALAGCLGMAGPLLAASGKQLDASDTGFAQYHYLCERGVRIPAVYINDSKPQRAIIFSGGRMIVLDHVRSADGARYAEDGEGEAGYIWWTKGANAMLEWRSEDGEVISLLSACHTEDD